MRRDVLDRFLERTPKCKAYVDSEKNEHYYGITVLKKVSLVYMVSIKRDEEEGIVILDRTKIKFFGIGNLNLNDRVELLDSFLKVNGLWES